MSLRVLCFFSSAVGWSGGCCALLLLCCRVFGGSQTVSGFLCRVCHPLLPAPKGWLYKKSWFLGCQFFFESCWGFVFLRTFSSLSLSFGFLCKAFPKEIRGSLLEEFLLLNQPWVKVCENALAMFSVPEVWVWWYSFNYILLHRSLLVASFRRWAMGPTASNRSATCLLICRSFGSLSSFGQAVATVWGAPNLSFH